MDHSDSRNPVEQLAEDFLARLRNGEHPALTEYVERHPELADEIRELFPALVMMEDVRPTGNDVTGDYEEEPANGAMPRRLGDYRILREVGRGGMGIVYEAEQESLGRHVALKLLPTHALLDAKHLQRFRREAKAAARLHHTNIVPVFGVGEQDGMHYYVMQFIQGQSLDEVLRELRRLRRVPPDAAQEPGRPPVSQAAADVARALMSGDFGATQPASDPVNQNDPATPPAIQHVKRPDSSATSRSDLRLPGQDHQSTLSDSSTQYWRSVARIGVQVADAIAYAHDQGTLHRDIKPSNLLLDTHGTVWVTDFGLAKTEDQDNLTHTGDIIGTLRYMAPERFNGHGDVRSDIYALGLTLYELLTLRPAFAETDRHRLVQQVLQDEPIRPRKLNPSIPRDLETIILKAIARDPGHRYQTATELVDDLRAFEEDKPVKARRIREIERLWRWCRRNPAVAALMAAVAVTLFSGTTVALIFAMEADRQATDANDARERATQKATEAEAATELALRRAYISDMRLAQRAWDENNLPRLRQLLEGQLPEKTNGMDLRGPEWHYFNNVASPGLRELPGPGTTANLLVINRDWTHSVWWSATDKRVIVCAAPTGRTLAIIPLPQCETVPATAISPDGALLALGLGVNPEAPLSDRVGPAWLGLYAATTGRKLFDMSDHEGPFEDLCFSPDGTAFLAISGIDHGHIWDTSLGQSVTPLRAHESHDPGGWPVGPDLAFPFQLDKAAFVADGRTVVLRVNGGGEKTPEYVALDAITGKRVRGFGTLAEKDFRYRQPVVVSPDGKWLATSTTAGVRVYDLATGAEFQRRRDLFLSQEKRLPGLTAYSPDGRRLLFLDQGSLIIGDPESHAQIAMAHGLERLFGQHPNGQYLAACGHGERGRAVRPLLAQMPNQSETRLCAVCDRIVRAIAFSPDSRMVACGGGFSGELQVRDPSSGRVIWRRRTDAPYVRDLAYSHRGDRIGVAGSATSDPKSLGFAFLLRADHGELIVHLFGHAQAVTALAFSPDDAQVATADAAGMVKLWDSTTGRERHSFQASPAGVSCLRFSPDGRLLSTSYRTDERDSAIQLWEPGTDRPLQSFVGPISSVNCACFTADGKRLVATGEDSVAIWDVESGRLLSELQGHSGIVETCAAYPDNRRIMTGGADKTVRTWDLESGQEVMTLRVDGYDRIDARVHRLAASPDGRWLAAGVGFEGKLQLWELQPTNADERAARHAIDAVRYWLELPMTKADTRELIAKDPWLPDEVRKHTVRFIEELDEEKDAQKYNDAAWLRVKAQYLHRVQHDIGLREAVTACRLGVNKPDYLRFEYLTTLAMAQYRHGMVREALATSEKAAVEENSKRAHTLYILSLCHAKLGDLKKAADCIAQAAEIEKNKTWTPEQTEELVDLRREAEAAARPTVGIR